MMDYKKILREEIGKVKPSEEEEARIRFVVDDFLKKLNKNLKGKGEAVIGGSFAKGTTIRKKRYDVDVFVLFKNNEGISEILQKSLKKLKMKAVRLPGSRDYFSIAMKNPDFRMEIVPVFGIKKAEEARNVTDVSILHVSYVKSKIRKNPKLADEMRLVKAFCYGQGCYGAESHIKGFSGYCLEILTAHYGSFMNLLKAADKWREGTIVDPEGHYSGKEALSELNEAKLQSPLILIDPVQKNRNAAAALSSEKFSLFIESARKFLKSPSRKFFERKEINESKIIEDAKKKKEALWLIESECVKDKEDISGAKLLKLHNVMKKMLEREEYDYKEFWIFEETRAKSYFSLKKPKKIIQKGPPAERKEHADEFRKRWKKVYVKNGVLYAEREQKPAKELLNLDKKMLRDMGIDSFRIKKIL